MSSLPHCWPTLQLLQISGDPALLQSPSDTLGWESVTLCLLQRRNAQRNFFHYHRVCIKGWIWNWKAITWHIAPRLNYNDCHFQNPSYWSINVGLHRKTYRIRVSKPRIVKQNNQHRDAKEGHTVRGQLAFPQSIYSNYPCKELHYGSHPVIGQAHCLPSLEASV